MQLEWRSCFSQHFFSVIDTFNTQHNEKEKISRKLLQTFLSAVKVHAMMSFVINCTSFKAYRDQLKLTASNLWNRKEELVLNFKLISFIRHFGHGALKWKEWSPSGTLLCLWQTQKNMQHHSKDVWMLGQSVFSYPSTKELHALEISMKWNELVELCICFIIQLNLLKVVGSSPLQVN